MKDNEKKKYSILVVDDNKNTLEILERNLTSNHYRVTCVDNVQLAVELLSEKKFDLLITDNKMPQRTGIELVKFSKDHYPNLGIIMITGYASIHGAVDAIKGGADEYVAKPFSDQELLESVQKTISKKVHLNTKDFKTFENKKWMNLGLIGESPVIKQVFSLIERASLNDATVLITGESGTGKELVARAIHYLHSRRSNQPFIPVNCPAIPENLFESELFGHKKGAFTGATDTKEGLFFSAQKGSIFLDEISELSTPMQAKLLRTLQEKTVCSVGSSKSEDIDVRIIAASNKNLERLIEQNLFREDLFYRLNVLNIQVPSLKERKEDIVLLAQFFIEKYAKHYNKEVVPVLDETAIEALVNYEWPGNIRELENMIMRCLIVSDKNVIKTSDLSDKVKSNLTFSFSNKQTLKQVEKSYIKSVLASVGGNKTRASEILGIDRKTLREKLSNE